MFQLTTICHDIIGIIDHDGTLLPTGAGYPTNLGPTQRRRRPTTATAPFEPPFLKRDYPRAAAAIISDGPHAYRLSCQELALKDAPDSAQEPAAPAYCDFCWVRLGGYPACPHMCPGVHEGWVMVYLRTVSGAFLKAESIVGLAPRHGDDGRIIGWLAVRPDGSTTPRAGFYSVPGRIEKALPHLFRGTAPVGPPLRPRFIVPYTDESARTGGPPEPGRHPSHSSSGPSAG